jgi:pyrroline-5-carboxylate reductase
VVSFVATVSVADVAKLVAPASAVCRMTPLTTIEKRRGPIVMAPALTAVKSMFDDLGQVVVAETDGQMMAFGCAAAVLSTFFEIEDTVAQWLAGTGVPPGEASLYVRSMFAGVANLALENRHISLADMALGNETPGGLNERVRASLRASGLFTRMDEVLSELASLSLAPIQASEPRSHRK